MATPDSRLLELTAVLTEVGLDWLALELLQGVRDGLPVEETPDDLQRAQLAVRLGKTLERSEDLRAFTPPVDEHLQGTQQLYWATEYILDRLTEASAVHKIAWKRHPQVTLAPVFSVLVTQRVGPFTLRREYAAPE